MVVHLRRSLAFFNNVARNQRVRIAVEQQLVMTWPPLATLTYSVNHVVESGQKDLSKTRH